MSSTLNYDLKNAPPALFDGARWPVLTMLIVHSNKRNRCWPTMETIAEKTGKALPTVTAAKKWLIDHGAIELVPYDKRLDDEKNLAPRRHVYQLTGKIKIDDKPLAYLYDNDTDNGDMQNDTPLNVSENEISASKVSVAKISIDKAQSISRKSRSKSKKEVLNTSAPVAIAPAQVEPTIASVFKEGQDTSVVPLPEPPKGKAWVSSSQTGTTLAHLVKASNVDRSKALCKASIKHRNKYTPALGPRDPCPVCLEKSTHKTTRDHPQYNDLMLLVLKFAFKSGNDPFLRSLAGARTKSLLEAYPDCQPSEFERFGNEWPPGLTFPNKEESLPKEFGLWRAKQSNKASTPDSGNYVSEIDTTKGKLYAVPAK